jgi:translation initiation factor IF-2
LDTLVEAILTQAEVMQLKADPTGPVEAVVVESRADQARGRLCTALIERGTLKKGSILVAGTAWAKVQSHLLVMSLQK